MTRVEAYSPVTKRWVGAVVYPSPEGLTIIAQDISDRVQAQEATGRLAAIVASSDDAIVGKQLDGTITTERRGRAHLRLAADQDRRPVHLHAHPAGAP